jgi:transcriptional regulator with GAF, ATPase, and Fis domain
MAVGTQVLVNRMFKEDFKITEAFVNINSDDMQSNIEAVAEYQKDFLSENDKKELISFIANEIGLIIDQDITIVKDGNRSEYSFVKEAKSAKSEIKIVSIEEEINSVVKMKHYIVIRLNIYNTIESMDKFQSKIKNAMNKIGIAKPQITLQFNGSYEGRLTKNQKDEIADKLIKSLQGKIAYEYEEGNIDTIYAYTGLLNEYIMTVGSKVNIQIAFNYNELLGKTTVYLATPILSESW